MTRSTKLIPVLLVLLAAGVALAAAPFSESFSEVKKPSNGASPTFVSALAALDGTDSTTWNATTALTGRVIYMVGDGTLEVVVRHSAAQATACVVVGRRARDGTFQGIAGIQTSTAGGGLAGATDGTGYYAATPLYYRIDGWAAAEVRVYDCSGSTTVDLKLVTQGAAGRASE